jgi:trans-aconitate methyltransferase
MGYERGPEFYDRRPNRVFLPLKESPWKDLYEMVTHLMPPPEKYPKIVDIGCGTGRFAKLLKIKGYNQYWGIDFSKVRITEASNYVPEFSFSVGNIFDDQITSQFYKYNCFILIDVLEHLNKDLALINSFPKNSDVVIAVPNFDSDGHVRYFKSVDEVVQRYSSLLFFDCNRILENIRKQTTKKKNSIFILPANKR